MGLDADHDNALLGQTRVGDTFPSMPMIFQLSYLLGQTKKMKEKTTTVKKAISIEKTWGRASILVVYHPE